MRKKGIFPYGYMNNRSKLFVPLLKQCECFDMLTQKGMDNETYNKMVKAYKHFDCKYMLEYMLNYLKGDCLQLFDAIQDFKGKEH